MSLRAMPPASEHQAKSRPMWTAVAEQLSTAAAKSNSEFAPWESTSGESPWQWAERVGIPQAFQLQAYADAIGAEFKQDLSSLASSPFFLSAFPIGYARRHAVLGLCESTAGLTLAM